MFPENNSNDEREDVLIEEDETATVELPNFAKMGTKKIQAAIDKGEYEGEVLDAANVFLAERASAPKDEKPAKKTKADKQASLKKTAAKKPAAAAKKTPAVKKAPSNKENGVSAFLRKIMTPKEGTPEFETKTCAVTYGEANKKVKDKFPNRLKLYPSEFDRNFEMLKAEKVLLKKQPPAFKTAKMEKKKTEKKPTAKKTTAKKTAAKKEVAPVVVSEDKAAVTE